MANCLRMNLIKIWGILLFTTILITYNSNSTSATTNLVYNGNFEISHGDDTYDTWGAASLTEDVDFIWDNNVYHGTSGHSIQIVGNNAVAYLYNSIPVQPHNTYTFSVWRKAQVIASGNEYLGTSIAIMQIDSSDDVINCTVQTFDKTGTFEWEQISCNFTVNSNVVKVYMILILEGTGNVWYDDVSLVKSDLEIPAAWSSVEAIPGEDRSTYIGFDVNLDGSNSIGDALSYQWRIMSKPAGSQSDLINGDTVYSNFTPDVVGDYTIGLTVSDGQVTSQEQSIIVRAKGMNDNSDDMLFNRFNNPVCINSYMVGDMIPLADGWVILSDIANNTINIKNGITGEVAKSYHLDSSPVDIDLDFDNSLLIATQMISNNIAVIDLRNDEISYIATSSFANSLTIGEGNIAFAHTGTTISIIDLTNKVVLKTEILDLFAHNAGLIKYDKVYHNLFLGGVNSSPSSLYKYNYDSTNQTLTYVEENENAGGNGRDLAISSDGKHLAFACRAGNGPNYEIYDYDGLQIINHNGLWNTNAYPTSADFSLDNKFLVATNSFKSMLFDVDSHTWIRDICERNGSYESTERVRISRGNGIVFSCIKNGINDGNFSIGSKIYLDKSDIINSSLEPVTISGITGDTTEPIYINEEINITVNAAGGVHRQYGFLIYDGNTWTTLQSYSENNSYIWKPIQPGNYSIAVEVRDRNSSNNYDDIFIMNYKVYIPAVGPVSNINSGDVPVGASISLSTNIADAQIFYTLDGSTPTELSTRFTDPFIITDEVTINAIVISDSIRSAISTFHYTVVSMAEKPIANPVSGSVASGTEVTLTTTTANATIYYTLDGSTPSTTSTLYTSPIRITSATTIKAIAVKSSMSNSDVLTVTYVISSSAGGNPIGGGGSPIGGGGPIGGGFPTGGGGGLDEGTSKLDQDLLIINGIPETLAYGDDAFEISTSGGSGTGLIRYELTSGDAVSLSGNTISILKAGSAILTITKPEDDKYKSMTTNVNIVVDKAEVKIEELPTVTETIAYGSSLSMVELIGGKTNVPGIFIWSSPKLILSKTGSYSVMFIPSDADNYKNNSTYEGMRLKINVNVTKKPKTLAFYTSSKTIALDQTYKQEIIVDDGKNDAYITYSSSNPSVATVDPLGEVTPISEGTTYITAKTRNGLVAKYKMVVKKVPVKITINNKNLSLSVGQAIVLKPAVGDEYYTTYTFTSNNESAVTASKNGKITAKKTGTAIITIKTHNKIEITCKVKVKVK